MVKGPHGPHHIMKVREAFVSFPKANNDKLRERGRSIVNMSGNGNLKGMRFATVCKEGDKGRGVGMASSLWRPRAVSGGHEWCAKRAVVKSVSFQSK